MWLMAVARVAVLGLLCVADTKASITPIRARPADAQFFQLLGVLANRYLVWMPSSTLILCVVDLESDLPWIPRYFPFVPLVSLCPGPDNEIPPFSLTGVMVVGSPERLLQTTSAVQPATENLLWETNVIVVVRLDDDDDGSSQAPLVRKLMALMWARSWGKTSVAVVSRELATLYTMSPFANSSGLCGSEPPSVVAVATVRMDRPSFATLPPVLYTEGGVVPSDLGGCVMRASLVLSYQDRCDSSNEQLPIESKIVKGIMVSFARRRNIKLQWDYTHDDKMQEFPNGTFSGPLGRLGEDTDVVLGVFALTSLRIKLLRPTAPFLQMPVRIMVRCPAETAPSLHVWDVMVRNLWSPEMEASSAYATIGALTVVAMRVLIARVSGVVPPRPWWWLSVVRAALLDQWAKNCEVPTSAWELCPGVLSARVLTGSWLLYVLIMNVAVKGLLFTDSAVARTVPYPQTMRDLLDAVPNLTVAVESDLLRANVNETGVPLERIVTCETEQDVRQCEDRFARDASFAVMSHPLARMKCLRGCHYPLATQLLQANYVNYVTKTNVLVEVLDQTIQRLQNGGIIEKMLHLEMAKRRVKTSKRQQQRVEAPGSWVMDPLYMFTVGALVATLVFLAEIIAHRV